MKTLYLIRGVPGSGKSTLASQLLEAGMVSFVFEADQYFVNSNTGEYRFDPSGLAKAHESCKNSTAFRLYSGKSVAVSNTSTTEKEVEVYRKIAEEYGAKFVSLIVENRHGGTNVHNVPEDKIEQQKQLADMLINKLRAFDPYVLLAGGAPRDWYFGNEASDLDIYVYQQGDYCTSRSIERRLNSLGFTYNFLAFNEFQENYEKNENIRYVIDIHGFDTTVQLIILKTPTWGIVDTFPLSICKIWYSPERGIVPTTDFKLSVKTKGIFKTNSLYSDGDKYVDKIRNKFKDYRYVGADKEVLILKLIKE